MRKHLTLAAMVMLTSFGSALVMHTCAQAQQTIQGMERKSQNRTTRAPEPSKRYGCNASGHGTRTDCSHARKAPKKIDHREPPREIDQDRVGMNVTAPPKQPPGDQ
jgi:hypothetical protein